MRTTILLLLLGLCILLTAPAVGAQTTVTGEVAGVPFSVGPAYVSYYACSLYAWYETPDLGVLYSTGSTGGGRCDVYVRAL